MIYEIKSKSDFLTGASLHVMIPEDELDRKALYTIQADRPDFILPFRHRCIDGQIELVYQIGAHSRLQYLSGGRSPKEYADLWSSLLYPLRCCGDWFMQPYSFVLSAGYLYCEKNKKTISYVYIPSIKACSDYTALKEMAAEITKIITVADADLENKVLRAILKDFDPDDFLQMLKSFAASGESVVQPRPVSEQRFVPEQRVASAVFEAQAGMPVAQAKATQQARIPPSPVPDQREERACGEIVINIPGASADKAKDTLKNKENSVEKKDKDPKKQKPAGAGLFGRKKDDLQDVIPAAPPTPVQAPVIEPVRPPAPALVATVCPVDTTQSLSEVSGTSGFKLVGSVLLPPFIDVRIENGEVFTVGRYDAAVGKQQSNFEFEKKTKAVSRRHAAIERDATGYSIVDLTSSAGTFVNGQKLPPNTPCQLGNGCRVSFGNAGADYIWEG